MSDCVADVVTADLLSDPAQLDVVVDAVADVDENDDSDARLCNMLKVVLVVKVVNDVVVGNDNDDDEGCTSSLMSELSSRFSVDARI